jgi:outer membrane protein assembly factor BamB
VVVVVGVTVLAVVGNVISAAAGSGAAAPTSWTVYHGAADGSGVASSVASVDLSRRVWTSPALDGELYGEPLVSGGRVYVATEHDTVYALSAQTGAVAWSAHVGTAVPSSDLPCGDISPTVGITGTPVIDEARQEIFVVADELVSGRPAHMLVGLNVGTGKVQLTQNADPPGSTPPALLQRTGLTLDAGKVVFGYGGNFGDCSTYRGWVLSIPEAGGTLADFSVDSGPGESQGAVWMGGAAPVVDTSGNVWVTAGNGSVTSAQHAYDDSDSVLELSPSLALLQYFAPASWAANNARDLDLSTAPALLSDGQVVAGGKTRAAYLLNGTVLGGVGGQEALLAGVCESDLDGGVAVQGTTVYLPCLSGPVALQASAAPAGLRLVWRATAGGGPPILAAGLVWTISQAGVLNGLDPASGRLVTQAPVGAQSNHFPTPAVGAGLLLAPTSTGVVAFAASTTATTTTTTTSEAGSTSTTGSTSGVPTTTAPVPTSGARSGGVTALIVVAGLAVAAVLVWLLRTLRRRRS